MERPGTALSYTSSAGGNGYHSEHSQARAPSAASSHTSYSTQTCPLCGEGDHEMVACPMYNNEDMDESPGKTSPSAARGASLARRKSGLRTENVWCDNCDVSCLLQASPLYANVLSYRRRKITAQQIVRWQMMSSNHT